MAVRVYSFDSSEVEPMKKLLSYDPYLDGSITPEELQKIKSDPVANIIFARTDYVLKDGIGLELDRNKYYLYIMADDAFLDSGEKKIKATIKSFARADEATTKAVVSAIEKERDAADAGVGLIFG